MTITTRPVLPEQLPAAYPRELERWLTLPDGRRVFVRPILPSDAERLVFEAERTDPKSLYQRFFTFRPNINHERARYLAEVDYCRRLALVALDEANEGVAVARYEGTPDRPDAEVAFIVKKGWRRMGLASTMLAMLEEAARIHGIERLTAVYLSENKAAGAVLAAGGFEEPVLNAGTSEVEKQLR